MFEPVGQNLADYFACVLSTLLKDLILNEKWFFDEQIFWIHCQIKGKIVLFIVVIFRFFRPLFFEKNDKGQISKNFRKTKNAAMYITYIKPTQFFFRFSFCTSFSRKKNILSIALTFFLSWVKLICNSARAYKVHVFFRNLFFGLRQNRPSSSCSI